jgi:hypothetical protein
MSLVHLPPPPRSSAVKQVIHYTEEEGGGQTTIIRRAPGIGRSDVHTVDEGDLSLGQHPEHTHTTRDGHPLVALYSEDHGWSIGVSTTP